MKEHMPYRKFTAKSELDKFINSLMGLIEGVSIDEKINNREMEFLNTWLEGQDSLVCKHPYNEIIPLVRSAISDGILTQEEKDDITWLCKKLASSEYYDAITADMQKLHAILAGISADKIISAEELCGLSIWLQEHEHLKKCWPYDEIESLITSTLSDQMIDENEHKALMDFFRQFTTILDDRTIVNPGVLKNQTIVGVCALCPEIKFSGAVFCVTGASNTYSRSEFNKIISDLGGISKSTVTQDVDYLIIGAEGNPCWAYACYGRKVEKAVELRKNGYNIMIIHENDFHDAVADM